MIFDKILKALKYMILLCWGTVLVGNIILWANGNPPKMSWTNIFVHETALVTMALTEIVRDNNLF
jgi:hypothetical protein